MRLENFPTNETAQEMMEMITGNGFYDNSYVGKWLFQVMGMEMGDAKQLFDELREQIFPETATWGIIYHEQKYGIPSSDLIPLEERRKKITQKRDIRNPMNPARLEMILSNHAERVCNIEELVSIYTFIVSFELFDDDSVDCLDGVREIIRKLKPSHLTFYLNSMMELINFVNQNRFVFQELLIALFKKEKNDARFQELLIAIYIKYVTHFGVDISYVLSFREKNKARLHAIDFNTQAYNFGTQRVIKLNGKYKLDGTWRLNQVFILGPQLYKLDIHSSIRNKEKLLTGKGIYNHILFNKNISFLQILNIIIKSKNDNIILLAEESYRHKVYNESDRQYHTSFHCKLENNNTLGISTFTIREHWNLNEGFVLDGSRPLGREAISQEI